MVEIHRIGENAGKVWHALNEKKELPIPELCKCIDASYEDTVLAIGWLAREHKINLYRRNNELFVTHAAPYEFCFG